MIHIATHVSKLLFWLLQIRIISRVVKWNGRIIVISIVWLHCWILDRVEFKFFRWLIDFGRYLFSSFQMSYWISKVTVRLWIESRLQSFLFNVNIFVFKLLFIGIFNFLLVKVNLADSIDFLSLNLWLRALNIGLRRWQNIHNSDALYRLLVRVNLTEFIRETHFILLACYQIIVIFSFKQDRFLWLMCAFWCLGSVNLSRVEKPLGLNYWGFELRS